MNAPCSGAPLTAPHVTTGGLCRWKSINKEGRHVGLDFYDLLIEDHYQQARLMPALLHVKNRPITPSIRHFRGLKKCSFVV